MESFDDQIIRTYAVYQNDLRTEYHQFPSCPQIFHPIGKMSATEGSFTSHIYKINSML